MERALQNWLSARGRWLTQVGIQASLAPGQQVAAYGANLDSDKFVGGVTYWPPDLFEFQFNDAASGAVIVLETRQFGQQSELEAHLDSLLERLLGSASETKSP